MKSFLALAVVAMISTSAVAFTDFSENKVAQIQQHIKKNKHVELRNLYNPLHTQRGQGGNQQGGDGATNGNVRNIGGINIDVTKRPVISLGIAVGSQSNPDIKGSCFYANVATLAFYDQY